MHPTLSPKGAVLFAALDPATGSLRSRFAVCWPELSGGERFLESVRLAETVLAWSDSAGRRVLLAVVRVEGVRVVEQWVGVAGGRP